MTKHLLLAALATTAFSHAAWAQAHHHGLASATLVLTAEGALSLSLEIPAGDILGFERAPQSAAETELVETTIARLSDPAGLFALDAAADCQVESADVELETHAGHAELIAHYIYACAKATGLKTIDAEGFLRAYPGVGEVDLSGLIDGKAMHVELHQSSPLAVLR